MEPIALLVWILLVVTVVLTLGRGSTSSVGLPLAFVLALTMVHFFGAAIHILGWRENLETDHTMRGFLISTLGFAAFVVGSQAVSPYAIRAFRTVSANRQRPLATVPPQYMLLPQHLLGVGLLLVLVVFPLVGTLPTLTALSFAGALIVIVAICLGIWRTLLMERSRQRLMRTLLIWGVGLPLFTLLFTHNVIRAVLGLFVILSFVVVKLRARNRILLAGLLIFYIGLSLGVGYLAVRDEFRASESMTTMERLELVATRFAAIEPFNPMNERHLEVIDARMNQNILVGTAQRHLEAGFEEYAKGETLWNGVIALIPRAIWPDKPVQAGSMNVASKYTGLEFAEGTAVGLGPILEFYLNFGVAGVLLGMLIAGTAVGLIDIFVANKLDRGEWGDAVPLFVLGLTSASVEGSFIEITVSAVAGWVMGWLAVRSYNGLYPRIGRSAVPGRVR